jgi:hypothetical protein
MNRVLENQRDVLRDREQVIRQKYQKSVDELNRMKAENEELKARLNLALASASNQGAEQSKVQDDMFVKLKMLTELVENLKYFKQELDQVALTNLGTRRVEATTRAERSAQEAARGIHQHRH